MKVYLATAGSYSDYHVIGAFTKREDAEEMCLLHSDANEPEEYELDAPIPQHPRGHAPWAVYITSDGRILASWRTCATDGTLTDPRPNRWNTTDCMGIVVWATSRQGAIKAANERRAQLIATNQWDDDYEAHCQRHGWGSMPAFTAVVSGPSQTVEIRAAEFFARTEASS